MSDILDRGIVAGYFVGHVASAKDAVGNVFAAFVQEREKSKPGLLIRKRTRGSGVWADVHWFSPDEGKFGHATLECVGLHLVVIAPRRLADGSTQACEFIITNVCEV